MKKIVILSLLIVATLGVQAQNAKVDQNGNYVQVKQPIDTTGVKTGKTFTTSKGEVLPVIKSPNGTLFVIRTSSKGTRYKMYLKL